MAGECYAVTFRDAARKVTAIYDDALAPAGVNLAQFSLLRTIERAAPLSLTALAALKGLDRSTVGRNVRLLERTGLVRTVRGEDGREAAVTLVPPGRAALARAGPLWEGAQRRIETSLGPGTAAGLRALLRSL